MNLFDLPALIRRGTVVATCVLLVACAHPAIEEARKLSSRGQQEAALNTLAQAVRERPQDRDLRRAMVEQRDVTLADLVAQAEAHKAAGRKEALADVLARLEVAAPNHPRVAWLRTEVSRQGRHARLVTDGETAMAVKAYDKAELAFRSVLAEDPLNARAREQLNHIEALRADQTRGQAALRLVMGDKPVNLEFRDATLRTVFETLARAADVNFVFDKDVRSDAKVTLFLKNTTVEEAMRLILSTQQLGHKLLNPSTVMVFPGTQQKQRDLMDTITRTFYLTNADPKQAQSLVRTVAKSRDVFIDERLNMLVVRDTPDVIRLVERLVQNIDIADPEVMMDVEVMEVSRQESQTLGISWPSTLTYGVPGLASGAMLTRDMSLRAFTTNPLAVASVLASGADTKILANPKIRARNHEKAKVVLAEKLPVFTTTSTPVTTGVSNAVSVSYLDVGIKLDIEPQVQLDDDVTIKIGLEVSSITNTVTSPDKSSVAYQVGTRQATTTLRLRDGETQVLAGLINDTESRSSAGLPFLHDAPLLGRLFGVTKDENKKTEIVLLVTPHIVRNVVQPGSAGTGVPSGTESQPGAAPITLRDDASSSGVGGAAGGEGPRRVAGAARGGAAAPATELTGPEEVLPGAMFMVTVRNPQRQVAHVQLTIDTGALSFDGPDASRGRISLTLPPLGQQQVTLVAKPLTADAEALLELDTGAPPMTVRVKVPQQQPQIDPTRVDSDADAPNDPAR